MGRELYDRLQVMARHMDQVGKALESSVQHYNRMTGSFERRVLTTARRFEDLGVVAGEDPALASPRTIAHTPRPNIKDTKE
jgi:DNA recombination protein RmuC